MPLQLTDRLGPQVDPNGRWVPISETLLEAQSAAGAVRRFITAQVSDIYVVTTWFRATSATVSGTVLPRVSYWDYTHGAGKLVTQVPDEAFRASDLSHDPTSSALMAIRAAASEIFISWDVGGTPPVYDLYFRISRHF